VLMRLGLTFNTAAAPIVVRPDWLGVFLPFQPSFPSMLKYSLVDVFTNHTVTASYNPYLWPMGLELAGSMLVFCVYLVYRRLAHALCALGVATIGLALAGSPYALFLFGIVLGGLRARGLFARLHRSPALNRIGTLGAIVAIWFVHRHQADFPSLTPTIKIALAGAVVFVCYASRDILPFMRSRLSRFLGRISFPLYFMQFAVIVSWTSWCIVYANDHPGHILSSRLAVIVSSLIITIAVATITASLEARYLTCIDRFLDRWILKQAGPRLLASDAGRDAQRRRL